MKKQTFLILFLSTLMASPSAWACENCKGNSGSSSGRSWESGVNSSSSTNSGVGGFGQRDLTPDRFKMRPRKKKKSVEDITMLPGAPEHPNLVGQWIAKQKQAFCDWTKSGAFEVTFGKLPFVSKLKSLKEVFKTRFDDISKFSIRWLNYGMYGAEKGVKHVADPHDNGKFEEGYNKGIADQADKSTSEAQKQSEKLIKENIKVEP